MKEDSTNGSRATGPGEVFHIVFREAPCTDRRTREYTLEAHPVNKRLKPVTLARLWRSDGDRDQGFLDLWRKVSGIAWSAMKQGRREESPPPPIGPN